MITTTCLKFFSSSDNGEDDEDDSVDDDDEEQEDNYHMFEVLELLQKENLPDKLSLHFGAAVCLKLCRLLVFL